MEVVNSEIAWANHWDHFLARIGINRGGHIVKPGLYALGNPSPESAVFVTTNYTLSFDALRSSLKGMDCYIMVLDTKGVNVWCAAGKGTFGTCEVIRRIETTMLEKVVRHRKLILPQLSSSGVSAFDVKKRSGFNVEFGPLRARDIPAFMKNGRATLEMRTVRFDLKDRLILIPVEIQQVLLPMIAAAVMVYFLGGYLNTIAVLTAVLAGTALFPMLLPWIPTKDFTTKGFILGILVAIPFVLVVFWGSQFSVFWMKLVSASTYAMLMAPVTSYLALNFTGSTPFTSRSGVRREIFRYIPFLVIVLVIGITLNVVLFLTRYTGAS
jgi:hypothetical protein